MGGERKRGREEGRERGKRDRRERDGGREGAMRKS